MVRKLLLVLLVIAIIALSFVAVRDLRPHPQNLGEYLQDLFVTNGIALNEEDFFQPVDDPYLPFAKILNLIPTSSQSDDRISERTARQISKQFLAVKDKLYLDGLYGKIDMHEHYRVGGDIDLFLKAAGCFGISKVVFLPTGSPPDNKWLQGSLGILDGHTLSGILTKLYRSAQLMKLIRRLPSLLSSIFCKEQRE